MPKGPVPEQLSETKHAPSQVVDKTLATLASLLVPPVVQLLYRWHARPLTPRQRNCCAAGEGQLEEKASLGNCPG
eukprot:467444-Amphidinium_carterae.1